MRCFEPLRVWRQNQKVPGTHVRGLPGIKVFMAKKQLKLSMQRPRGVLFHEFFKTGCDGVSPDLIALGVEMQQVRHDFLGQRAVRLEKL